MWHVSLVDSIMVMYHMVDVLHEITPLIMNKRNICSQRNWIRGGTIQIQFWVYAASLSTIIDWRWLWPPQVRGQGHLWYANVDWSVGNNFSLSKSLIRCALNIEIPHSISNRKFEEPFTVIRSIDLSKMRALQVIFLNIFGFRCLHFLIRIIFHFIQNPVVVEIQEKIAPFLFSCTKTEPVKITARMAGKKHEWHMWYVKINIHWGSYAFQSEDTTQAKPFNWKLMSTTSANNHSMNLRPIWFG